MTITVIPRRRNIEWLSKNIEKHMSLKIPQKDSQHRGPCFDFFLCSDHQSNKKWDKKNQQKLAQKSQQVWVFLMIPTTSTISQKSIYEEFWKKIFSRSQEMLKHTEKQATTQTNKQTHFTVT